MLKGSVTELGAECRGAHVIVGSHGAAPTGLRALCCGVASLICHDAGIGLDMAGVAALPLLGAQGVPAAAVSHETARIGDPNDMLERGRLSRVNQLAEELGVVPGITVRQARALLGLSVIRGEGLGRSVQEDGEFRRIYMEIELKGAAHPAQITILDSASSVREEDSGAILVTGSHGGLPNNSAEKALKTRPLLVAFNDAGIGIDMAGTRRLPILAELGVAAACVDANSARIGDGLSTYETGILSVVNAPSAMLGANAGMPLRHWISHVLKHADRPCSPDAAARQTISKGSS